MNHPNTTEWISSHEPTQIEDTFLSDENQFDRQFYGCEDHECV